MSDLRDDLDRMIDAFGRMSLLAQLRDKVRYAQEATDLRCGDCQHWMKSRICPKERNVNGYTRGPSRSGMPCEKFQQKNWSKEVIENRALEAIRFAEEHDLPIPTHLKQKAPAPTSGE